MLSIVEWDENASARRPNQLSLSNSKLARDKNGVVFVVDRSNFTVEKLGTRGDDFFGSAAIKS